MNSTAKTCANCSMFHPVRRCWALVDFVGQPDPEAVCAQHQGQGQGDSDVQAQVNFAATVKEALLLKSRWVHARTGLLKRVVG
jgi:hypothetical protein